MAKQQQLSPEKYIQIKARTLKIGACYINPGWEEAKLATVAVQRLHSNGNITAGIYMVDLLCRGIKDSFYFFNQQENEIEERFEFDNKKMWQKIDYDLTHNIVYAGHDFAMDYHIEPHKMFSVTKYLLEEDNDEVPLIEIETGDAGGKPHLLVSPLESYGSILSKLKQYAGEGNYTFTIADPEWEDEDGEDDEEEEYDDSGILDAVDESFLDFNHVSEISTAGLLKVVNEKQRTITERFIVKAELLARLYNEESDYEVMADNDEITETPDYIQYQKGEDRWMEANEKSHGIYAILLKDLESVVHQNILSDATVKAYLLLAKKYSNSELTILALFQTTPLPLLIRVYNDLLKKFDEYPPTGQLFLTVAGLLIKEKGLTDKYNFILKAGNITEAYPADMRIHGLHHKFFWFVKAAQALQEEDERSLWHWHNLISVTGIGGNLKFLYALKLKNWLEKKLNIESDEEITTDYFSTYRF